VYSAPNANLKEKHEADLKKEIKKLQRYRDDIKKWATSSEIKNKDSLLEWRHKIEEQMERFKVCEKETKTKAFSKEGLAAAAKKDPNAAKKAEIYEWIEEFKSKLQEQSDLFEAEIEEAGAGAKKGQVRSLFVPRALCQAHLSHLLLCVLFCVVQGKIKADKLKASMERHAWHQTQLDLVMDALRSDKVSMQEVEDIRDDIETYVEQNQDPDFFEDEFLYDGLNLDAEDSDDGSQSGSGSDDGSGSGSGSEDDEVDGAAAAAAAAAAAKRAAAEKAAKEKAEAAEKAKVKSQEVKVVPAAAKPVAAAAAKSTPTAAAAAPAPVPAVAVAAAKVTTPVATVAAKVAAVAAAAPPVTAAALAAKKLGPTPVVAGATTAPSAAALVARSAAPTATVPSAAALVAAGARPSASTVVAGTAASAASAVKVPPVQLPTAPAATVSAPTPVLSAAAVAAIKPATPAAPTPLKTPLAKAPVVETIKEPEPEVEVAPVRVPLSDEHAAQLRLLEASLPFVPEPHDSERYVDCVLLFSCVSFVEVIFLHFWCRSPKQYLPRNPYRTPSYFPSSPALSFEDGASNVDKFDLDTLFFMFYFHQGSNQHQALFFAARELKKQAWRYHKKYLTWFQRHEEPKVTSDEFEQGTYLYFDYEQGWCQRLKHDFVFDYRFLEDDDGLFAR
jgi:CCR4-NOT transcription complex subunit 3